MTKPGIRSREQLLSSIAAGHRVKYLFFWGHQASRDGQITSSCFSQWFDAPFDADGHSFATAEHYMMARKAQLFRDDETFRQILAAKDPGKAKALGRSVRGFEEAVWLDHRWSIVVEPNRHKFTQHPALQDFLLGTAPRILVEASPVDSIWGIGLDARAADAKCPARWKGLNLLGFALMEVRSMIDAGEA